MVIKLIWSGYLRMSGKVMPKDKEKMFQLLRQYHNGARPSQLCRENNVPESTFFDWLKKYPKSVVCQEYKSKAFPGFHREMRHLKKIEEENRFLKRVIVENISPREKMAILDKEYGKESTHVQCDALCFNRSTYLNHLKRNKNNRSKYKISRAKISEIVIDIFQRSGHVYGSKKITAILRARGEVISEEYVRGIMIELGLKSTLSPSNRDYMYFVRRARNAGSAGQKFHPRMINEVWVSDTSCVFLKNMSYYICACLDLCSRKVVGYKIGLHNSTFLTKQTFQKAYRSRKPGSLTLHTDNGSCFLSYSFEKCLRERGVTHSYSRPNMPRDNAVMEHFFGTLKREGLFKDGYPTSLRCLEEHLKAFVEYYNSKRPHENLNYLSPDEYEKKLIMKTKESETNKTNTKSNNDEVPF